MVIRDKQSRDNVSRLCSENVPLIDLKRTASSESRTSQNGPRQAKSVFEHVQNVQNQIILHMH